MRRIDKSNILATQYFNELQEYVNQHGRHPEYTGSTFNRKHYKSVFINLLCCQKGVCAYTEALISSSDYSDAEYWKKGSFKGNMDTKYLDGDIEHFDPRLKTERGWEWSNLFIVIVYVNRKIKLSRIVDTIFRPDLPDYSPEKYMTFNFRVKEFVPHPKLEFENPELFQKVKSMIEGLGLNTETIKSRRTQMLLRFQKDVSTGCKTIDYIAENELVEFFTAFEMSKQHIVNQLK